VVTALGLGIGLLVAAAAGLQLRWPLGGAITAALGLVIIAFTAWRTAQATAIVRRGINRVALGQNMVALPSGPARVPLLAPSLFRTYGLRSGIIFVLMIVAVGAGTFMLGEAANVALVIGRRNGSPVNLPMISAWLDTPGGIAVAPNGDIYFADSNNNVIDLVRGENVTTVVGDRTAGFSGDDGPATRAQLDTPDGVTIAPDGDLIVADSHNDRVRRVDRPTRVITTIAGSGDSGYDGDDKPATEASLNTPNGVWATPNGDIYIADTLNHRIRLIDHVTGFIHTVAGDGEPGGSGPFGDGGPATSAHLFMPSDVAVASNGDIYIADMHHNRVRRVDARTGIISTVAGTGAFGSGGDDGPATNANLAGPAGIALAESATGVTIFIADYYNGLVRAVGPNGIIRNVSDEGRIALGAPSRIAFAPQKSWLYVADSSENQIVALIIPKLQPRPRVAPRPVGPGPIGANPVRRGR
jgi:sugar lactone lactonase YvrE